MSTNPFDSVIVASDEAVLLIYLREFEKKYFPPSAPIKALEVTDVDGPSCSTSEGVIQINPVVSSWPKTCKILILHELIHHALRGRNGDPDAGEGEHFQDEVKRLWDKGAYRNLL
jgi:hypothetical protein